MKNDPSQLTPKQRFQEVACILARGLLRLKRRFALTGVQNPRQSLATVAQTGERRGALIQGEAALPYTIALIRRLDSLKSRLHTAEL